MCSLHILVSDSEMRLLSVCDSLKHSWINLLGCPRAKMSYWAPILTLPACHSLCSVYSFSILESYLSQDLLVTHEFKKMQHISTNLKQWFENYTRTTQDSALRVSNTPEAI